MAMQSVKLVVVGDGAVGAFLSSFLSNRKIVQTLFLFPLICVIFG
jgi:malate/lactate dehydrogenase